MICEDCMIAADLNLQNMHCGTEACTCQHRPGERFKSNLVACAWCGKRVNLTRVGRVMHWHKDNRGTQYGKWGLKCTGSGRVNPSE